ncbi:MAG: gliding motility-associated C-terminal domain-containing protein [Bacteroidetes bacterium]|nr:gliding motility-associated C-terminal domain-containing protein [Fibrella sp.]
MEVAGSDATERNTGTTVALVDRIFGLYIRAEGLLMMVNVYMSGKIKQARLPIFVLCLLGSFCTTSLAQFCTGTLGGAVVNQTFGSDGPYQLRPGQTTYTGLTACPNDGEYLISPATTCYSNNWHSLYEDHTPGDTKGNMLVVNAAQEAGEFYKQTVPGLCNGTTYEFSAWIINLVNTLPTNGCNALTPIPLDPNVTFRVELPNGQVLKTINTGSVPRTNDPTWTRYAALFTLPPSANSVVIKLINNGPGGCGNDLALDDIQLRPCRPTLRIGFGDAATTRTLSLCEGVATPISAELDLGYTNPAYQWQVSTDSVSWQPVAGASQPDYRAPALAPGTVYYRLLGAPAPGGTMAWDTTCSTVSNTLVIKTVRTGECESPQFYVPDAFTPNSDGVNDRFRAYFSEGIAQLTRFQLRVYNQWGSVIFVGNELSQDWDGTYSAQPCAGDVYLWVVECQLAYASRVTPFTRSGRVLLIR